MLPSDITREYVELKLQNAIHSLRFGDTWMGVFDDEKGNRWAIGRRWPLLVEPQIYKFLGILGPLSIDFAQHRRPYSNLAVKIVDEIARQGKLDDIFAVVADSYMAFSFFAEGVVVDNKLFPIEDGWHQGLISIKGRQYTLLVKDGVGVLGLKENCAVVNKDLEPMGFE